jgi:hypothetical protein
MRLEFLHVIVQAYRAHFFGLQQSERAFRPGSRRGWERRRFAAGTAEFAITDVECFQQFIAAQAGLSNQGVLQQALECGDPLRLFVRRARRFSCRASKSRSKSGLIEHGAANFRAAGFARMSVPQSPCVFQVLKGHGNQVGSSVVGEVGALGG